MRTPYDVPVSQWPSREGKGGSRAVSDAAEVSAVFAQCTAADGTGYFGNQR